MLTDQPDQRRAAKYWNVLKTRLKKEGSELTTNCSQLKMLSADGKRYNTDVTDTQQFLRIIQSIPSPKAEPFKLWLAEVGRERIEETIDSELTIEQALTIYLRKGYTREWINQRLQAIQARKRLTAEWDACSVQKGVEYAGADAEYVGGGYDDAIFKGETASDLQENLEVARAGGTVAGHARTEIDAYSSTPVITSKNAAQLNHVLTDMIESLVIKQHRDM